MSLDIDKIILHSLRAGNDGQPHADTRSQTLPADEAVQGLMAELHRIYNGKGGKGFGFFADPEAAVAELAEGEEAPSSRLRPFASPSNSCLASRPNSSLSLSP